MTLKPAIVGADRRVFLFMQGPSSSLYVRMARKLEAAGSECLRVNLNAGDAIFWRRGGAINYRGSFAAWQGYVGRLIAERGITDLVVHGEERPYHKVAIAAARQAGVAVYAVEMGHLRPDWVTIEREGLSSNSRFPIDPDHILTAGEGLGEPDWQRRYSHSFLSEAAADMLYYLPTVFLSFLYPHYRRHGLFHPLAEYAGWAIRLAKSRFTASKAVRSVHAVASASHPYFVYPLQLQTDYQLRSHSPFHSQQDAIRHILRSFAEHAAADARLVIKVHPLDNGLIDWRSYVEQMAATSGVSDRTVFIDGGNLDLLIRGCSGLVTVNSTAALNALQAGRPVKVLGSTVYDIDGLTDRQPLDAFWSRPVAPSPLLLTAFMRLLAASIQVRGNFYSREGAEAAAGGLVRKLLDRSVNEPGAYVDPAPRSHPEKIAVA